MRLHAGDTQDSRDVVLFSVGSRIDSDRMIVNDCFCKLIVFGSKNQHDASYEPPVINFSLAFNWQ
jgi:hypothetical protein